MISRSNYEVVFIDYFDGKLDKVREGELFRFLKENPDLQEEFNMIAGVKIEPDLNEKFANKENLKRKPITLKNYKTWLIAYVEKDLTEDGEKEVENFLNNNSAFKKDLELLKLTRLVPDHQVIYSKKNSLKRGGRILYYSPAVRQFASIAAALFILAIAYFIITQLNTPSSIVSDKKGIENNDQTDRKEIIQSPDKEQAELISPEVAKTPKEKVKSNHGVVPYGRNKINKIDRIDSKQVAVDVTNDSLRVLQIPENSALAHEDGDSSRSDDMIVLHTGDRVVPVGQLSLNSKNISDIFSEEEIKELQELQKIKLKKPEDESKKLADLASEELEKLSKKTDIRFEKINDSENNSVTYAFGVGKNFSLSHTSGK